MHGARACRCPRQLHAWRSEMWTGARPNLCSLTGGGGGAPRHRGVPHGVWQRIILCSPRRRTNSKFRQAPSPNTPPKTVPASNTLINPQKNFRFIKGFQLVLFGVVRPPSLSNDMELRQGFPARARYRLQAAWRLGYREGPQATACCLRICASERYVGRAFLPHAPPMINDPPVHTLDVRHPHEFVAEPSLVLVLELDVAPDLVPGFSLPNKRQHLRV